MSRIRKRPDSGHNDDNMNYKLKRAKQVNSINTRVQIRNGSLKNSNKTNTDPPKRKTFKDFFLNEENLAPIEEKENNDLSNSKNKELAKKLQSLKMVDKKDGGEDKETKPARLDNVVDEESLFPANILEKDSFFIKDHTIKTNIKIHSTQSMEWINSISFNSLDSEVKAKIDKCLSYYAYPSLENYSNNNSNKISDLYSNTQLSLNSKQSFDSSRIDKEWVIAFKDLYVKWLSFNDSEGSTKEFCLVTTTYKAKFISMGILKNGEVKRKKFAVVGNPSKPLCERLKELKVDFKTFKNPHSKSNEGEDEEDSESEELNLEDENLLNEQDGPLSIKYQKDYEPITILIEDDISIHSLVNTLLSF